MNILKLATLNIFRNRRRTMITTGSVAFGIWLAASFVGTREHTYKKLVDAAVRMGAGHVTVAHEKYLEAPGPAFPINGVAAITTGILSGHNNLAVYPRIVGNGILATADRNAGVTYFGIDPDAEHLKHNLFLETLTAGGPPPSDNRVYLGRLLAEHLGVTPGERLVLTVSDRTGQVNSHLAIAAGVFATGNQEPDAAVVLANISFIRKILGYSEQEASFLAVYVDGFRNIEPAYASLTQSLTAPDLQVFDWNSTQKDLAQFIRYDAAVYRILIFFIGVIIASGILNTLVISIIERRREFGVMLALGMTPWKLFGLIITEGTILGLFGVLIGGISYIPLYLYLNRFGVDLTGLLSETIDAGGITIEFIMKCELSFSHNLIIGGCILVLTLLASLYPAWKAATIIPVRSLHQ